MSEMLSSLLSKNHNKKLGDILSNLKLKPESEVLDYVNKLVNYYEENILNKRHSNEKDFEGFWDKTVENTGYSFTKDELNHLIDHNNPGKIIVFLSYLYFTVGKNAKQPLNNIISKDI